MGLYENKEELSKLDDERVEDVAGGYMYYAGEISAGVPRFEVIDDNTGEVLDAFEGDRAARKALARCKELGVMTKTIDKDYLAVLRKMQQQGQ